MINMAKGLRVGDVVQTSGVFLPKARRTYGLGLVLGGVPRDTDIDDPRFFILWSGPRPNKIITTERYSDLTQVTM